MSCVGQASEPRDIFTKTQMAGQMCSKYVALTLAGLAHIVVKHLEVLAFYRVSRDIGYLLKVVLASCLINGTCYQRLFTVVSLNDMFSRCVIEKVNPTMAMPLGEAR